MSDSGESLTKIVNFLLDYPLKKEPVPDWMPDTLKEEQYPGKDYVVGFCEEAIDEFMTNAPKAKLKESGKMMREVAEMFREIMERRKKQLQKIIDT